MAIPDFQTLMAPMVRRFDDGGEHAIAGVREGLAVEFGLTDEELEQRLPSGTARTFSNRCGWAVTYLARIGLLERRRRGVYLITARGKSVLRDHPNRIDLAVLSAFPEFAEFRERRVASVGRESPIAEAAQVATPAELLDTGFQEITEALVAELRTRMSQQSPAFFEQLVLDVLSGMGYGGSRSDAAERLGKSGDGGIDGVIRQDRLGLDEIYVQAKRWERGLGRPDVQGFVGALQGVRASRGVMISTGSFSREAREYAAGVSPRVVLIDGEELARLMIEHDVGVGVEQVYAVKRINSDYFGDDEI